MRSSVKGLPYSITLSEIVRQEVEKQMQQISTQQKNQIESMEKNLTYQFKEEISKIKNAIEQIVKEIGELKKNRKNEKNDKIEKNPIPLQQIKCSLFNQSLAQGRNKPFKNQQISSPKGQMQAIIPQNKSMSFSEEQQNLNSDKVEEYLKQLEQEQNINYDKQRINQEQLDKQIHQDIPQQPVAQEESIDNQGKQVDLAQQENSEQLDKQIHQDIPQQPGAQEESIVNQAKQDILAEQENLEQLDKQIHQDIPQQPVAQEESIANQGEQDVLAQKQNSQQEQTETVDDLNCLNQNLKFDQANEQFVERNVTCKNHLINQNNENTIITQITQKQKEQNDTKIKELYQQSCWSREVPEEFKNFVGEIQQLSSILEEEQDHPNICNFLRDNSKGLRRIRGDGNCFYTAFGYQFLRIILTEYEDASFNELMQKWKKLPFSVNYKDWNIVDSKDLLDDFITRLENMREQKGAQEQCLFKEMSDSQNTFYGLAIIFLRNLINELSKNDAETMELVNILEINLEKELLEWEEECSQNELIIKLLSEKLDLSINVYFIDRLQDKFKIEKYGNNEQNKINLLFSPGHYQIGII